MTKLSSQVSSFPRDAGNSVAFRVIAHPRFIIGREMVGIFHAIQSFMTCFAEVRGFKFFYAFISYNILFIKHNDSVPCFFKDEFNHFKLSSFIKSCLLQVKNTLSACIVKGFSMPKFIANTSFKGVVKRAGRGSLFRLLLKKEGK